MKAKKRKRHLIPHTFTIRPDQARYIEDSVGSRSERSRWVRDAIDARIDAETTAAVPAVKKPIEENRQIVQSHAHGEPHRERAEQSSVGSSSEDDGNASTAKPEESQEGNDAQV